LIVIVFFAIFVLIGYGLWDQMKDLLPIFIHSLLMWGLVLLVVNLMPTLWLKLIVGVLSGMIYYIAGAFIMKFPEMNELLVILRIKSRY
jgi:hypothetical protein